MAKPDLLWEPFEIEANRTTDYKFFLYKSDKKAAALAATDAARFKLSKAPDSETPTLDLISGAATANGSTVTINALGTEDTTPAEVTVRFAQGDTKGLARREDYHGELIVIDDSETAPPDAAKRAGYGPVTVKPAAGGSVALA
jgi:hypothetical protein